MYFIEGKQKYLKHITAIGTRKWNSKTLQVDGLTFPEKFFNNKKLFPYEFIWES